MTPLMMPIAGLSFADVSMAAIECGGNKVRTARKLGVGVRSLYAAIERENLQHWFVQGRGKGKRPRQTCVTKEQIEQAAKGHIKADAADALGISPHYLRDLCRKWKVTEFAGDRAMRINIGKFGYAY